MEVAVVDELLAVKALCFHALSSAASETESPRRNIGKAVRRVFWRILVFYVSGWVPFNLSGVKSDIG